MLSLLKLRPFYFITAILLLLFSLFCCVYFSRQHSFLLVNGRHNPWMDIFFIKCTLAGDGLVSVAVAMILAVSKKMKEALTLLVAYISSGLFAQLLKHLFDQPRPNLYFKQLDVSYHVIKNVTLYASNSFPSGHTTSAFAIATAVALLCKQRSIGLGALLLAALVAYSRIYLAQHFLSDVVAGAFIGIFFGMLSYYFICQQNLVNFSRWKNLQS